MGTVNLKVKHIYTSVKSDLNTNMILFLFNLANFEGAVFGAPLETAL